VHKPGDRLILIAAMLEHQSGDREQMRDIGNRRSFADLQTMQITGIS
jgi:hypothetical protein